jgi:hypothetical protein
MTFGTVRALVGEGSYVSTLRRDGRVKDVEPISMPPDGPLAALSGRARVRRGRFLTRWWWFCTCAASSQSHMLTWEKAYRGAYLHVRIQRFLQAVEAAEIAERENDCGD